MRFRGCTFEFFDLHNVFFLRGEDKSNQKEKEETLTYTLTKMYNCTRTNVHVNVKCTSRTIVSKHVMYIKSMYMMYIENY